ncbi:MAG: hypothetical protein FWD57_01780 [Polyangiaceae bacterium]|nr:hypothetical protein [Polyangiaceae bacterium]
MGYRGRVRRYVCLEFAVLFAVMMVVMTVVMTVVMMVVTMTPLCRDARNWLF